MISCYPQGTVNIPLDYNFYFKINSIEELDFNTSEYLYYLNNANYFYISSLDFNNSL